MVAAFVFAFICPTSRQASVAGMHPQPQIQLKIQRYTVLLRSKQMGRLALCWSLSTCESKHAFILLKWCMIRHSIPFRKLGPMDLLILIERCETNLGLFIKIEFMSIVETMIEKMAILERLKVIVIRLALLAWSYNLFFFILSFVWAFWWPPNACEFESSLKQYWHSNFFSSVSTIKLFCFNFFSLSVSIPTSRYTSNFFNQRGFSVLY